MSILVKAGAGLAAGVVAGALGLMLVPRLEPSALRPRSAVEKPQFVVASPTVAASPQAVETLAVATEAPAPKSTLSVKADAATPSPSVVAAQTPDPKPVVAAKVEPPAPTDAPVVAPSTVAVAAPPAPVDTPAPSTPVSVQPAPPDAARWSVRGLVALARGDISSARLFLARAAEAGDARAWVALADTYDPAMLTKFGVVVAPGDPQRAKDCLVKAVAAGVVVPKDRLAALDSGERPLR